MITTVLFPHNALPASAIQATESTIPLSDHYNTTAPQQWSSDGRFFAFGHKNTVSIFDKQKQISKANQPHIVRLKHKQKIKTLTFFPQCNKLLVSDHYGTLAKIELTQKAETVFEQKSAISPFTKEIDISSNGNYIATQTITPIYNEETKEIENVHNCTLYKWDKNRYLHHTTLEECGSTAHIEFTPKEDVFLRSFHDGRLLLLDLKKNLTTTLNQLTDRSIHLFSIAHLDQDGYYYCAPNNSARSWKLLSHKTAGTTRPIGLVEGMAITAIATNKNKTTYAASNEKGVIFLLNNTASAQPKIFHHPHAQKTINAKDISRRFIKLWFNKQSTMLYGISADGYLCCWQNNQTKPTILTKDILAKKATVHQSTDGTITISAVTKNNALIQI